MLPAAIAACVIFAICAPARAADGKFHVTDAERAACTPDATQLCAETFPEEDRLITCMKSKRSQLSTACRPVFEAGIKRRGL